jgi:hypothetical protein
MEGCDRVHGRLQLCVRQVRALALRLLSECDGHVGRALNRVRTQLAQGVASSVPGAAAAAVPAEKAAAAAADADATADADADAGAGEDADTEAEAPPRSPARSSSPDEEEWVAREQAVHLAHMEQAAALRAAAEQAAEQAAVLQAVAERGLASCGASCLHTPRSRPGSRPGSARLSSARLSSASQSSAPRSGDAVAGRDPEAEVALLYTDMEVELDEAEEGGEGDEGDEADEAARAAATKGGKKKPPGACATVCGLLLGNLYLMMLDAM